MNLHDRFTRTFAQLRHRATASNTMGFGIHSPYLFNIARAIVPCRYPYYAFSDIERLRNELLTCEDIVCADVANGQPPASKQLRKIARHILRPSNEDQLLMRLAVMQHAREIVILEADLGVSAAYLAKSDGRAHLTAFEQAEELAAVARKGWAQLGIHNIDCIVDDIEHALSLWHPEKPLDMAVFSAEQSYEVTMQHFNILLGYAEKKSLFVLTDIHGSSQAQRAWKALSNHPAVTATMDLCLMGLVFFDENLEKRTYSVRF